MIKDSLTFTKKNTVICLTLAVVMTFFAIGCTQKGAEFVPQIFWNIQSDNLSIASAYFDSLLRVNPKYHSGDTTIEKIESIYNTRVLVEVNDIVRSFISDSFTTADEIDARVRSDSGRLQLFLPLLKNMNISPILDSLRAAITIKKTQAIPRALKKVEEISGAYRDREGDEWIDNSMLASSGSHINNHVTRTLTKDGSINFVKTVDQDAAGAISFNFIMYKTGKWKLTKDGVQIEYSKIKVVDHGSYMMHKLKAAGQGIWLNCDSIPEDAPEHGILDGDCDESISYDMLKKDYKKTR